ncbi:MAG: hypothetical protein KF752_04275 [Pirellulaceae bacterium]|nr:hypothetical protein [Pirellulaceae bacterium]
MSEPSQADSPGLKSLIPGYMAYHALERRRDDDRLTRQFIVKRIEECKSKLDALGLSAAMRGDLDLPLQLERLRTELDRARSRISAAVEGYSHWFGGSQTDPQKLKQLTQQDQSLVSVVDLIDQAIGQSPLPVEQLDQHLQMLHQRIDRRGLLLSQG